MENANIDVDKQEKLEAEFAKKIHLMTAEPHRFDISAIDFDLLRREFAKVRKKNLVMKDLEDLIQEKLARLLFNNPIRINYYERYQ